MHPISGAPAQPPGEGRNPLSAASEQPLSMQQRTVLERLITRLISLTQQQSAEVWAGMKHDLGIKNDAPLLSRHFPAAEQNLTQRLGVAQQNHANRQVLSQLTELLGVGNNRQAVSDFIRQQYGQTALSQLTPDQLKNVLTLLQQGAGGRDRRVKQTYLAINAGTLRREKRRAHSGKTVYPSGDMATGQTLSLQHAPTLHTLQAALKQPLEPDELTAIKEYAQHTYQIQPQTVLTTAQVQDLLNHIFLRRVEREADELEPLSIQPIYRPFAPMIETVKNLSARPGLLFIALIIVLALFWLVS